MAAAVDLTLMSAVYFAREVLPRDAEAEVGAIHCDYFDLGETAGRRIDFVEFDSGGSDGVGADFGE